MQKIIGIGNALVDILVRVSHDGVLQALNLPKGSMQLVDSATLGLISKRVRTLEHTRASGGSAANTVKALARMGAETGFIGKTASDEFGMFFRRELESAGVQVVPAGRPGNGSTGIASTFITPDGGRTFATYLGAAAELRDSDITEDMLKGYDILYVEGYLVQNHALMERVLSLAAKGRMTVCLDLASYNVVAAERDFFRSILARYVDIVFANEEEARAFTGEDPLKAARRLGDLCRVGVVKMGERGSCVMADGEITRSAAVKVDRVVDTTGAGDYFAAGFLYALVAGGGPAECLAMGSRLASRVIRVVGTTLHDAEWQTLRP